MKKGGGLTKWSRSYQGAFAKLSLASELAPGLFGGTENQRMSAGSTKKAKRIIQDVFPVARVAATKRNMNLKAQVKSAIDRDGRPKNKAQFISKLRNYGALQVVDADGKPRQLTERTVSRMLGDDFHVKGRPGRKKDKKVR